MAGPAAFFSYAHADDDRTGGAVTALSHMLADELQLQAGGILPLFRDRENLAWGEAWQARIDDVLDAASLLVAVISPSFLSSRQCRRELARFLDRERRLDVRDLVLPVYWVDTPLLNDEAAHADDELVRELATRQYADWRELRFDLLPAPAPSLVRRHVAKLAACMVTRLCLEEPVPGRGDQLRRTWSPLPATGGRGLWMVPAGHGDVVARPRLMAELVRLLLREKVEPVVLATALQGAGGFGKTTLAGEVCRNPEIAARFPAGILWVTVGENTANAELAEKINDLSLAVSGQRPTFSDPEQAGFHLGKLLGKDRCMIVVDDVWRRSQLQPFLLGGPGCLRLITTRRLAVVPDGAATVTVDAMEHDEATRLLTARLDDIPGNSVSSLLGLTGRWPVLLALVNGAVRRRVRGGATAEQAFEAVTRRLLEAGPGALDVTNPEQRHEAVAATLDASLALLAPAQLERYLELAIFPEDVDIPRTVLETYWGATGALGKSAVDQLCWELADLSLVQSYAQNPPALRLHDVIRSFLRQRCLPRLSAMNQTLLDSTRASLLPVITTDPPPWWLLPVNHYLWNTLGFHLCEAERVSELVQLVRDLRYVTSKIRLCGPAATDADLALVDDPAVATLRRAIGQASHLLTPIEPDHALVGILLGRLDGIEALKPLVASFETTIEHPRLANRWPLPDRPHPALRRVLTGHTAPIRASAISPEGNRLVTVGDDGVARVWNIASGRTIRRLEGHVGAVYACAISPDGTWLATAGYDGTVRIWDLVTGRNRQVLEGHVGAVYACAISPDETWLATTGYDGTVRIWDLATGRNRQMLERPTGAVYACAIGPGGRWMATVGEDRVVRTWDVATGRMRDYLKDHTDFLYACAASSDGSVLATAGYDGIVRLWDPAVSRAGRTPAHDTGWVSACAASADGSVLATAGYDGLVRLWDVASGRPSQSLKGHSGAVETCAVSPYGSWLATAGDGGLVRIWDAASGQLRQLLEGHTGWVLTCAASPDGSWLATAGVDRVVRLWDMASGRLRRSLKGHSGAVETCAVSPDGSWLATAGYDRTVLLWDVATGVVRQRLDHGDWVHACAIGPDGRWLASAGADRVVRIWDVASSKPRQLLDGHTGPVRSCAVTSNGRYLATAGDDRSVRIWDLGTSQCLTATRVEAFLSGCCWLPPNLDLCVVGARGVYMFTCEL